MKYQVQENCLTIYLPREVDQSRGRCGDRQKSYQICDF